jgi:hypothetical protein
MRVRALGRPVREGRGFCRLVLADGSGMGNGRHGRRDGVIAGVSAGNPIILGRKTFAQSERLKLFEGGKKG